MRYMMIVKGDERTEAGVMPSNDELAEMAKYNEELVKAGVMLAGDGLHPTARGFKVHYDGSKRRVVDGPFTEAKEVVGGYALMQCKDKAEAIEWTTRFLKVHEEFWTVTCEVREIAEG
jgi:hypothetical protein